jgi:hypothetical protein
MDALFLERTRCYFGGGPAIVLQNGEYRLSADIGFLCADRDGYRERRMAATERGARAFFGPDIQMLRPLVADQYGIRGLLALHGQRMKFEIMREGREELDGAIDPDFGVPVLTIADQFTEKLMANADRCLDRAVAYRNAIDLGYLVETNGSIPFQAIGKAEAAYGRDVTRYLVAVLDRLALMDEVRHAADTLEMAPEAVRQAASRLHGAAVVAWPEVDFGFFPGREDELPES